MPTFKHSGKIGDIIYALPAIRALGGGHVFINVDGDSLILQGALSLIPLLEEQSYITGASVWQGESYDLDLDQFRQYDPAHRDLVCCHLLAAGLEATPVYEPWLQVRQVRKVEGKPVVFGGAANWLPIPGFWETCYRRFGQQATLVGLPHEHARFQREIGPIHYTPTRDLLQLAEVIAGGELFVGSQSGGYAVAEALKQNSILGVYRPAPNCTYDRDNAYFAWHARHLQMIATQGRPPGNAHERHVALCP